MEEVSSPSTALTNYRTAGLHIASEMLLPGLTLCHDEIFLDAEILIRRAQVPGELESTKAVFPEGECNENEFLLIIPKVARFLIRNGAEILVQQERDSSTNDVIAYLIGTAFGILCHQRGITPLHACAIDVTGGCVAFMGESGAGKSTLAATLAVRGYQVIADDVCFLKLGEQGLVRAWPGVNRIRLWEGAMKALGCDGPGVEREIRAYNKYIIPIRPPQYPCEPRRLLQLYQLNSARVGESATVSRLQGAAAVEIIMQNIYRLGLAENMGYKPAAFAFCAATARAVPVFRFNRPMGFNLLAKGIDVLEDHLRASNWKWS